LQKILQSPAVRASVFDVCKVAMPVDDAYSEPNGYTRVTVVDSPERTKLVGKHPDAITLAIKTGQVALINALLDLDEVEQRLRSDPERRKRLTYLAGVEGLSAVVTKLCLFDQLD
jgi:hypothetical protein